MMKRLLLSLLAVSTVCATGCSLLPGKNRKPKESTAIASDVEREFERRWVAKRVADLASQGITGAAAEQQARQEFAEKFAFARRGR